MTREDKREITVKGLFLGLILFVSALIVLLINQDMMHLQIVGVYLIPIIAGYALVGMFLRWMVYRSTLRNKEFHLFSGAAAIYWIWLLTILLAVCSYWIPQVLRYIVLANAAALLLVWLIDYLYLKNIAKELNSGLQYHRRTLVEDLSERPQTKDMFIKEIENYCRKNSLPLEIIEYGIPAKIKMNNILYQVQLGQYYTMLGTVTYTLEFHSIVTSKGPSL